MEPNNGLSGAKIALLVDFDNVVLGLEDPGFDIELVVNALRERGTIVLGRVYGDWYRHNRHRRRLMEQGLELVETPAFGPVIKNSADIRIALDGFEIGLTQSHIDTFAIVSGDSDFLPLIKKLQSLGRRVLVICGNRFTSDMLRRNCNEFISYENLLAQSVGATEDATTLEGAFSLLHRAMAALRERGTEIRGSGVKQMMIQLNPVFSERTFGCTQFRQFLQKAVYNGIVKLGPRDKTSGEFHVLLPDEDEAPIQQKVERRQENRARRDDKLSQIAARIQAIPVEVSVEDDDNVGVEIEVDAVADGLESDDFVSEDSEFEGGHVFADDAFGYDPETMAQARTESLQEIAQNTIARSELLARGLRPSKRRFSGQSGRPLLDINESERASRPIEDDEEETFEVEAGEIDAGEVETPEIQTPVAPAAENRRLRSRRRRRSASGQITVVADETAPTESTTEDTPSAISSDETANDASSVGDGPDEEAPRESIAQDAKNTDESELEFSHDLLNVEEESNVEVTEQVEAPEEAVADIQSALDELQGAENETLDESKGITVEADAPALPEASANVETSDPSGVPAKAKRRRPSRSKKAALGAETEAVPVVDDVQAEVAEAQPEVEAQVAETPVEVAPEAQADIAPETEVAPAKPRRRRPSRAKKSDVDSEKSSE